MRLQNLQASKNLCSFYLTEFSEWNLFKRDQGGPAGSVGICRRSLAELSDLISRTALITQQMGTERSVTKTKTSPRLDYGSCGVRVPSSQTERSSDCQSKNRLFPTDVCASPPLLPFHPAPVCLSAPSARDPCIPPVFISHWNTILIMLICDWATCGRCTRYQGLFERSQRKWCNE